MGFDLLATLFIALGLVSMSVFLRNPGRAELAMLWMNLLLLTNIRYESFLYVLILFAVLLVSGRIPDKRYLASLFFFSVPLYLPLAWQRALSSGAYQQPLGQELFSSEAFLVNLTTMLRNQLDFTFRLPYNNILTLAALPCGIWALISALKKKIWSFEAKLLITVAALIVGVSLVINFAHTVGVPSYSNPTGARLYLLFSAACAFMVAAFCAETIKVPPGIMLSASLLMFYMYHSPATSLRFVNDTGLTRLVSAVHAVMEKHTDSNALVVAALPSIYVVADRGAIDYVAFNSWAEGRTLDDELRLRRYTDIIFVQEIFNSSGQPKFDCVLKLPAKYKTEVLYEAIYSADAFLRISRLIMPNLSSPGGEKVAIAPAKTI